MAYSRWLTLAAVALLAVLALSHLGEKRAATAPASFVGSNRCRACHSPEAAAWTGSHHAGAMAEASDSTVRGRFDGPIFFRRGGKFFARTDDADGKVAEHQIRYTFGVYPLQQYLVSMAGGRLQALTTAWDSRRAPQGGQRWLRLYPDSRMSDDELHWTRPAQNWNYMCADCHSTAVRKNYIASSDSFHTTWSEISVGCEACHGPGSRHIAWAADARRSRDRTMGLTVRLDERRGVRWTPGAGTHTAARSRPRATDRELQVCAQCHSRRAQIADGYVAGKSYYDYYRPVLLNAPLYHSDGQQRGEVYEWGSFLQSRMNARGVTCSDCHEPHSGQLRAPGNALCASCHSPEKYDSRAHDHHDARLATGRGVTCVACHMPAATYMQVDSRRDHSIRIPRPDLTVALGTPNACAACHSTRSAQWAAQQIVAWRSGDTAPVGFQRFAGRPPLDVASDSTESPIARATALAALAARDDRPTLDAISKGLNDPNPLLRLGALQSIMGFPAERRAALAAPLLSDSLTAVRVDASRLEASGVFQSPPRRAAFERARDEYVAVQQYNADRADALTNLGTFFADQGDVVRAESELRAAIRRDPFFPPAYVNLADILRAWSPSRDAEAEQLLRQGLVRAPSDAALHHALGLALIRLGRPDSGRGELKRAAALNPSDVRFGFVYAVALHAAGQVDASLAELQRLSAIDPTNPEVLQALATYRRRR